MQLDPQQRKAHVEYAEMLSKYVARQHRAEQCQRGYRDKETGEWVGGLYAFVKYFWHILEPESPMVPGWPMEAICEHLEAVTYGEIRRLLINVPPGFCKSLLVDVFWPAWEWACAGKSHLRYVTFSYSASLTERDNRRFGDLVTSIQFRDLYGTKVKIVKKGDTLVTNTRKGWKLASSVGGVGTGERGDRVILDDPHNVKEAESDIVRTETVRWFRESMSDRLNDMKRGAIIIIMQRVHEDDVSGAILSLGLDYCHLMVPMEYDISRAFNEEGQAIETAIGWIDPRLDVADLDGCDLEPAWDERFPLEVIQRLKKEGGPYKWAGQYQQSPAPRGGGIFKSAWWQVWEGVDGKFPMFDLIIASVDSAFTQNEMNDPTGMTVWGVWHLEGKRRLMLVNAWRKHLEFSGVRTPYLAGETKQQYNRRTQETWGLMEWVQHTCERFKVDKLLIEAKASGISAAQELRNRYGMQDWNTQLCPVKGDKVARATGVQAVFSNLGVYAPVRDWSDMVIQEMAVFPNGKYKDLTDSATQAVKWLRDNGHAPTDEEVLHQEHEAIKLKPKEKALYPV
jgi:predicted phage terminase large subunit-like protein